MTKLPPDRRDPGPLLEQGELQIGRGWSTWTRATATQAGRSPWQSLGRVWDTRPDECEHQNAIDRTLQPDRAPGGLVLRTQYLATQKLGQRFAPVGAFAIQLCAAAWDWAPNRPLTNTWPGPKEQAGISLTQAEWPFADAYDPNNEADRVKAWAIDNASRMVLDVAPYLATPGAEIDISELTGGARYVILFWRAVNVLRGGTDPETHDDLKDVQLTVPWELRGGRALHPAHRDRWFLTEVLTGIQHGAASEGALFDSRTRLCGGWTPPIAGTAHVRVTNGSDTDIIAGLEEWAGGPSQRVVDTWTTATAYQPKVALTMPARGLLTLYAAHVGSDDTAPKPALFHLEVGR